VSAEATALRAKQERIRDWKLILLFIMFFPVWIVIARLLEDKE